MSKEIDWKGFKQSLLDHGGFGVFYESLGAKKGANSKGWVQCKCPFHSDTNPSFGFNVNTGRWACFSGCGKGSIFDYFMQTGEARNLTNGYEIVANQFGIPMPQPGRPVLQEAMINEHASALQGNAIALKYLREERGLTDKTIADYRLGFDHKTTTFPLWEGKKLVNIRRRSSTGTMSHWTEPVGEQWVSYGTPPRLYPNDDVSAELVLLCEGELDTLTLRQAGLQSFTGTHGANTFRREWLKLFEGRHVVIVYDVDDAGRKGAADAARLLVNAAASVRIVALPLSGEKGDNDISDWFRDHEGSADKLRELIANTPPVEKATDAAPEQSDPVQLASLRDISSGDMLGQLVQVSLSITGTTSDTYAVPETVKVSSCKGEGKGLCYECKGAVAEHRIPLGENVRLAGCHSSRSYTETELGRHCCKHDRRPQVDVLSSHAVREVFAHELVTRNAAEAGYLERKIFLREGVDEPRPGNYSVRAWVLALPKTNQTTLLVEDMVRIEDDFESFVPSEHIASLELLQDLGPDAILADVRDHVTQIYERDDLLAAVLLTFFSPRWITFRGRKVRGWLNTFVVGDAGTGKTQTYQRLADHLGIGETFSSLTGSRTGLLYAVYESKAGWSIKVGRHPQNTGRILAVDEVQHLAPWELRTLSKAMEEGVFQVDRVVSHSYESQTRMVMLANPKDDVTLTSFSPGCRALASIAPPAVIRRIDLPILLGAGDLETLPLQDPPVGEPLVPVEALRAAILWAWHLAPESVVFSPQAEAAVLREAAHLTAAFGGAPELPLMHASDAHNTLARLAAARAAVSLSAGTAEFDVLRVAEGHVIAVAKLWRRLAESSSCGLGDYSDACRRENELGDAQEALVGDLLLLLRTEQPDGPLRDIINVLLTDGSASKVDLELLCDATDTQISECARWLRRRDLVRGARSGGIKATPRLTLLMRLLRQRYEGLFTGVQIKAGSLMGIIPGSETEIPFG